MLLSQPIAASRAEMSVIHEEKKVQDPEDDKVAQAELLANEALRLATESKRAAEKLAEIRAAIAFLQSKSYPTPQVTASKAEEREEAVASHAASVTVVTPVVPALVAPVVVEAPVVEAPAVVQTPVTPTPVVVQTPVTPTPVAPAPVKKPELTVDVKSNEVPREAVASPAASVVSPVSILKRADSKAGAKEFRFSPEVVDPSVPVKAQPAPVHTINSVMSDDEPMIVKFCDALGMERLCSLEMEHDDVPLTKDQKLAYIKNAFDMEAEGAGAYVAMARTRASVVSAAVETPAPSTPASVASTAVETPVPSTPVVTYSTVETPVEETRPVEIPAIDATAKTHETLTMDTQAQPVETPAVVASAQSTKELTIDSSSIVSESGDGVLSPIKFQILANAIAPRVIHQPDPFAGEIDDMDFTCGWGSV